MILGIVRSLSAGELEHDMSASMHVSDERGGLLLAKSFYRRESLDKNGGNFRTRQITAN